MPRLVNKDPNYRLHRASGQAIVTLNGHDIYLGPYSKSSSAPSLKYDRLVGEWRARGRQQPATVTINRVNDVILAYWTFAQGYYKGESAKYELGSLKMALAVLKRCYGQESANDFGPLALETVREAMMKDDWSRRYINAQITRIKRCFSWAVASELLIARTNTSAQFALVGMSSTNDSSKRVHAVTITANPASRIRSSASLSQLSR